MKKIFILLILVAASTIVKAQVNVGVNEDAVAGSSLQLKDFTGVMDSTQNAYRGLAMPRVQLSRIDQLFPMFLKIPTDTASGPNDNYAANKANLDMTHTGLLVYNLTTDADQGLTPGLTQWNGSQWISLSPLGGLGTAIFAELTCSNVVINGGYVEGIPTGSQNSLTLTLDVQSTGAYAIIVQSGNGYSFYATGMALNTGELVLIVPAQGTPINAQTDNLTFSGISLDSSCDPQIEVSGSLATYSLNCGAMMVNGSYIKGIPLNPLNPINNTIQILVTVTVPGSYSVSTPLTNGISFSAIGEFPSTGNQVITLLGSGTPNTNSDITLTVNTNSPDGTTACTVTVPITAPPITYAIIGDYSVYSWNNATTPTRLAALQSSNNFGPTGIVKVSSFTPLWNTTSATNASTWLTSGYPAPGGAFPDIVLYNTYNVAPTNVQLPVALANYVRQGGCLIFGAAGDYTEWIGPVDTLLLYTFGNWVAGTAYQGQFAMMQVPGNSSNDCDYQISNLPNDPIINGPFGNLCNFYWGEDNTGSVVVPQIPNLSVQICSANNPQTKPGVPPTYSIVWYNTLLNFVFFGDCGGASTSDQSTNAYPVIYTAGAPVSKLYGPGGSASAPNYYIYNSYLEMNAVAWAIKRALANGINPH